MPFFLNRKVDVNICRVLGQLIQLIHQSNIISNSEMTELIGCSSEEIIMMNKIDLSKSIPTYKWSEFFEHFTSDNRGRYISIEIIDEEIGNQELIKNAPLLAMIYDRPDKGDNLAIEVGKEQMTYGHTIDSPTEVSTGQNADGEILAMSIIEASGRKTLIKLEAT